MDTGLGECQSFEPLGRVLAEKERQYVEWKIVCTYESMGGIGVVAGFLPSPAELTGEEHGVKVTLVPSESSVAFFKFEASKHDTQQRRMIGR